MNNQEHLKVHTARLLLDEHPFASSFDKFIQHQPNISKNKSANVKRKKFRRVPHAQLQSDVRLRRVLEPRIFHLSRDLICSQVSRAKNKHGQKTTNPTLGPHRTALQALPYSLDSVPCTAPGSHPFLEIEDFVCWSSAGTSLLAPLSYYL